MFHSTVKLAPAAVALLLAACGGDSEDVVVTNTSPTAEITTANQQAVAVEVSSNALEFSSRIGESLNPSALATVVIPAEDMPGFNLREALAWLQSRFPHEQARAVAPQAVGVEVTAEDQCATSGTIVYQFDDRNGNSKWDVSESGMMTFRNCVESGVLMNGLVSDTLLVNKEGTTKDRYGFFNFKVSQGAVASEVVSGALVLTTTRTFAQTTEQFSTTDLKVKNSVTKNSQTVSSQFTLNEDIALVQAVDTSSVRTISGNGRIQSSTTSIGGSVSFTITTPIVVSSASPLSVSAGQMTITGSNGTTLALTFASPDTGKVTLQLSKNGATVGPTVTVPAASLLQTAQAQVAQ